MSQKGYLLATAGGVAAAAAAGGAQAADLGMPLKAPPPVAPAPSWTGLYVGVHAGAEWTMNSASYGPLSPLGFGIPGASLPSGNGTGFIGGAQIGYNWQSASNIVLGLEATISGLTGKGTATPEFNTRKGQGFSGQITWLSTFRARAGWLMSPDTLLYGTGGLAVGGIKDKSDANGFSSTSAPFTTKSVSKTKSGWVAGGGIEHMLTRNWSLGLEMLYVDLGKSAGRSPLGGPFGGGKNGVFKNSAVSSELKLNYKF